MDMAEYSAGLVLLVHAVVNPSEDGLDTHEGNDEDAESGMCAHEELEIFVSVCVI